MKKIAILVSVVALFSFLSCSKSPEGESYKLKVMSDMTQIPMEKMPGNSEEMLQLLCSLM